MIRCVYTEERQGESRPSESPEWASNFDCRIDVVCGASVGGGRPPCDASRAVIVLRAGVVLIFGPPSHTFSRAPGANDWDHLEAVGSFRAGEGHELWVGYGQDSFDENDMPYGQAFWKIRFRGCPEHDDAPHYVTTTDNLCAAAERVTAHDLRVTLSIHDLQGFVQQG